MNWYYSDEGAQKGPISEATLRNLVTSGQVAPDSLVWKEGMADWAPFRDALGGSGSPSFSAPLGLMQDQAQCAECCQFFPPSNVVDFNGKKVCATCKPRYLQKLREGVEVSSDLHYGGFWIRFGAKFLDGIIQIIVFVGILFAFKASILDAETNPVFQTLNFSVSLLMIGFNAFLIGRFGFTLGKGAAGLRIVRPDGSRVGYGRALGRCLAEMLSGILFLGYLMCLFDHKRRTLHDRIAGTVVIRQSRH